MLGAVLLLKLVLLQEGFVVHRLEFDDDFAAEEGVVEFFERIFDLIAEDRAELGFKFDPLEGCTDQLLIDFFKLFEGEVFAIIKGRREKIVLGAEVHQGFLEVFVLLLVIGEAGLDLFVGIEGGAEAEEAVVLLVGFGKSFNEIAGALGVGVFDEDTKEGTFSDRKDGGFFNKKESGAGAELGHAALLEFFVGDAIEAVESGVIEDRRARVKSFLSDGGGAKDLDLGAVKLIDFHAIFRNIADIGKDFGGGSRDFKDGVCAVHLGTRTAPLKDKEADQAREEDHQEEAATEDIEEIKDGKGDIFPDRLGRRGRFG